MSNSFREEFNAQSNKVSDKWDIYLSIYDRVFAPYQEKEISLLEIGIQNGGSLEVYARYFRNHKLIVGCDIDPRCASLSYPDYKNVNVVVGDANTVETKERVECDSPIILPLVLRSLLSKPDNSVNEPAKPMAGGAWGAFQGGGQH